MTGPISPAADGPTAPGIWARTLSLKDERSLWKAGHTVVAGVDETGWGSLAGPVSVGAAVVPRDQPILEGLRDSKAVKERHREALFELVAEWCTDWAVGHATHEECDQLGLLKARNRAARRALDALEVPPDHILVDGAMDFVGTGNTTCLRKGDATSASISAASVLAKAVRDRIMRDLSAHFPDYEFESNKGYYGNTPRHKDALLALGPSGIHRRNTKTVKSLPRIGTTDRVPDPLDLAGYSRLSQLFEPDGVTRRR